MITLEQAERYAELSFAVEAEIGRLMLPVREVLSLAPGRILRLPGRGAPRVRVLVGDVPFALGEPAQTDHAPAVRLRSLTSKMSR